jgi:hypothetical protein
MNDVRIMNPLLLRGGGRGWGEAPALQDLRGDSNRELSNVAHHPTPQPPPLKRRGRAASLSEFTQ